MTLSCPGCHAKHKFRDDIAIDRTVYVRCPACKHMMMISPRINNPAALMPRSEANQDAPPALPVEIMAAVQAARANLWRLETLDLARQELDTDEVRAKIREGAIGGSDLIAHVDKNDWRRVEDVPELRESLVKAAASRPSDESGEKRLEGPEAPAQEKQAPFWMEPGRVASYPFRKGGPTSLVINLLFVELALLADVSLPLCLFNLSYGLTVVRESAVGRREPPGWEAFVDIFELFARALKMLLVTLVAWLPLILFALFADFGPFPSLKGRPAAISASAADDDATAFETASDTILAVYSPRAIAILATLAILVMSYYPICVARLAVVDRAGAALSPTRVIDALRRLRSTYAMALLMMLLIATATALLWFAAHLGARALGLQWLGTLAAAGLVVYAWFVALHVLGRLVHENEDVLGWSAEA